MISKVKLILSCFQFVFFPNCANCLGDAFVYFLQSETKLETKEESHLEEEGPSISQEKLALPYVTQSVYMFCKVI